MTGVTKTPIRLQHHPAECGSVCLGIVLEWLGESLSNSRLRNLCGIGRDGANIRQLQKGAQELGYSASVSKKGINTLKKHNSPLIIHWDLNHFLVFEGIINGVVYLNDPAAGRRAIPLGEFKKHFTGICIEIIPESGGVNPAQDKLTRYQYFFPLLWKQSCKYLLLPAFIFVTLELLYAGIFHAYYDYAVANELSKWVGIIALSAMVIVVLRYRIYSAFSKSKVNLIQDLEFRLNSFFVDNLIPKSVQFFESHYDGEISYRITQLRTVSVNLTVAFFSIAESLPFLVISLLIILFVNPPLFLVLFLPYFLLMGYRYNIHYKLREHQIKQDMAQSRFRSSLNQRLFDLERFKAMGLRSVLFPPLKAKALEQQNAQFSYQKSLALYQSLSQALDSITLPAVLFSSSYLLLTKGLTFGAYSFTYMLGLVLIPKLKQIQDRFDTYIQTKDLAKDSEEFFTGEDEHELAPQSPPEEPLTDKKALFQAYQLGFSYNETQSSLLRNISLSVYEGDVICFIGESGCGKTTLLEVMSGQRRPTGGNMLYKQRDAYRRVDSGFVFAHEEVKGNLADFLFADNTADEDKMRAALELVELEAKFDFEIEKGGMTPDLLDTLSVGEKQRLSLARAYCFNPKVIFFDEAFSHVDIATSSKILSRIKDQKITMIMATHRSEIQQQATRKFVIQ